MEFEFDDTQTMLRESVQRWTEKHYDFDRRRRIAAEGGFAEENWRTFAEMGWLGAGIGEDAGGFGGSAIETAIIMEEFGKALVLEPFLGIGVVAAQALIASGDDKALDLVPTLVVGEERIALAHEEPGPAAGEVTTVADAGGRISGIKTLVLGGPVAGRLIVSARSSKDLGLYLVDRDAAGVTQHDYRLADGSRTSEYCFDGAFGQCIAANGGEALDHAHACGIAALSAEAVGVMDRALWLTRDYLRERRQFGRTLSEFQVLQHRMADMLVELELSRSAVMRALAYLDAPPDERREAASACKAKIGSAGQFICGQAIHLHGGMGVTEELIIGHYFKRMTCINGMFGSPAHHLASMGRNIARAAQARE